MSLWIGGKEVGLAPGQTSGEVGGEYLERPASVSTSTAYIPGKTRTEVKVERDSSGKPLRFNLYKYDEYGNLMSVGEQRAGRGNLISTTPLSRISQEQAERYNIFQQKEYQQSVRLAQERQQAEERRRQVQQQAPSIDISRRTGSFKRAPAFQYPTISGAQDWYKPLPPAKRYYAVSYPSGFGSVKIAHEYKPGEKFKILGLVPYGEPKPGKLYKSDILGFTREVGDVKEESISSAMERGALTGVSTTDIKLSQLGNLLAVSPFVVKYPYLKTPVSAKGKPILKRMFGSSEEARQKKVFGGEKYYVEPTPITTQKTKTLYRQMFGGEAKTTKPTPILKNMFGTSAYQKPRKTTVMDILLVQPQRQRQITRPAESMWRQVISKPSEIKPRTDFEAIYQQQAVKNIRQFTEGFTRERPLARTTPLKPITTKSVFEQINLQYQYRQSPQAYRPVLRTLPKTQYKFLLGIGTSSRLLSGLMQGQRQEQRFGQLFKQQFAQAYKQGFKQTFDYKFEYPSFPKIRPPGTTTYQPTPSKTPGRQPPKTPPPKRPPPEPPLFRIPKIPPVYIPQFEAPALFGTGMKRKYKTTEKVIITRMLSLKDLFR